ncbi:hypothetical protein [Prosthecomicrobium sp. N25]|uniref:hypothetical protein n=1 Tax=Prosthecomicrobium sp. N25 TaxID=3129254 RepID=UPI003076F210
MGFLGRATLLLGGLIVWGLHFGAIYAANTILCTFHGGGPPVGGFSAVQAIVAGATLAAAAALLSIAAFAGAGGRGTTDPETGRFVVRVTRGAALLALLAVAWNALAAFVLPACA